MVGYQRSTDDTVRARPILPGSTSSGMLERPASSRIDTPRIRPFTGPTRCTPEPMRARRWPSAAWCLLPEVSARKTTLDRSRRWSTFTAAKCPPRSTAPQSSGSRATARSTGRRTTLSRVTTMTRAATAMTSTVTMATRSGSARTVRYTGILTSSRPPPSGSTITRWGPLDSASTPDLRVRISSRIRGSSRRAPPLPQAPRARARRTACRRIFRLSRMRCR